MAVADQTVERAPRTTDPKARAIAQYAQGLATNITSPFRPAAAASLMTIVGRKDPMRFVGLKKRPLAGREPRDVLLAWVRGELASDDPACIALRERMREIASDERGRNLWSRQIGAMLLAMADLSSQP